MPSGAKKRKAAKKKKETLPNDADSTHSHGNDDVKQQDDKEGDVGNVSSAPLEGKEDVILMERNVPYLPSGNGTRVDIGGKSEELGDGVIQAERNVKIENGSDGKDERIEHFEAERKSYNVGSQGSSSRSSSSSSDEEIHGIKNSKVAVNIALVARSLPGKSVEDNIDSAPIRDHGNIIAGNSVLEKQAEVETVSTTDNTLDSYAIEYLPKGNGEGRLIHVEENFGTSKHFSSAAPQRGGEEIAHSAVNIPAPYNPKEQEEAQENEHRLSVPQCAPAAAADDGSTTEALLVPLAPPAQKTSWKSCCGLFDLFSGTGA